MYLFLDFDGVMHPGLSGTFIRMELLASFLRAHPAVKVVITSTWRLEYSLDELRRYFPEELRTRVVGVTDDFEARGLTRYAEIRAYMGGMPAGTIFAILDDLRELYPVSCPELILCETVRGLRPAQIRELEQVFLSVKP